MIESFEFYRRTPRLRHAGPIVFELRPRRPTGVAWSRIGVFMSCAQSHYKPVTGRGKMQNNLLKRVANSFGSDCVTAFVSTLRLILRSRRSPGGRYTTMFKRLLGFLRKKGLGLESGPPEHISLDEIDDPELRQALTTVARTQAAGLDGATVTIHSVQEHFEFHGATPQPSQKLIVVDVTFKNYRYGFGLAGVELLEAQSGQVESLGGDPHKIFLQENGALMKDQTGSHLDGPDDYTGPIRVLLVYSAPKTVRKIALGYWSKVLVERGYDVAA